MTAREDIVRLIVRYTQGLLDEEEQRLLAAWRAEEPEHEAMFRRMTSREELERNLERFVKPEAKKEEQWRELRSRTTRKRSVGRVLRYAAAVVFLLVAGGTIYWMQRDKKTLPEVVILTHEIRQQPEVVLMLDSGQEIMLEDESALQKLLEQRVSLDEQNKILTYPEGVKDSIIRYHTIKVPQGRNYQLTLSDGTKVQLNAETELTYPVTFAAAERWVHLLGEAYFEVAPDAERPFTVRADSVRVCVLGTSFGVRVYPDEDEILTTLKSGKVSVESPEYGLVLSPDMQAVYRKETQILTSARVDIQPFLAWTEGRWLYSNQPLEKILRDLSRWYGFEVCFERESARTLPFTIDIKQHRTHQEILQFLEETGLVDFEIGDNKVIIK